MKKDGKLSKKQLQARRNNAQHSTGPRTEIGKARVALNAVKHAFCADKNAYAAMVRLGEDPTEYASILGMMVDSNQPQNGQQLMVLEDGAMARWQLRRNQRSQTGMVELEIRQMEEQHAERQQEYEQTSDDAPPAQLQAHGLASLPPSERKFQRVMDLLGISILAVEEGKYGQAAEWLEEVYGTAEEEQKSSTVKMREWLEGLQQVQAGEMKVSPTLRRTMKTWVLEGLEKDRQGWHQAWLNHLATLRPPSQADYDACFTPKGKVWRAAQRQAAMLERRIEKNLRLYWDLQKHDRERIVRQYEESKLEATAEEAEKEQAAETFVVKMTALIKEFEAQLKAVRSGSLRVPSPESRVREEGSREEVGSRQKAVGSEDEESASHDGLRVPNPESRVREEGSREEVGSRQKAVGSEAPNPESRVPEEGALNPGPGNPNEEHTKMTEQSEELIENKGPGSENKPETGPTPAV